MEGSSSSSDSPSTQRKGLGFSHLRPPSPSPSTSSASSTSSSDGDAPGLSTVFGGRRSRPRKRRRSPSPGSQQVPGAWEAHTRGIGSRILAKQGFTGRLGRRGDGIAEPLQPEIRRGKVGLGAGKRKEEHKNKFHTRNTLDDLDAEIEAAKKRIQSVQKATMAENEKTKADLSHSSERRKSRSVSLEVWNEIGEKLDRARRTVSVVSPQLLYDLNRLRDTAITQLSAAKLEKRQEEFILQNTASEKERAQGDLERVKADLNQLVALENMLSNLQNADDTVYEATLKQLSDTITQLSDRFYIKKQSITMALSELVCETVKTKLYSCLKSSQKRGKADIKAATFVGTVLQTTRAMLSHDEYSKLCATSVLGPLRRVLSRPDWDAVRGACIADILIVIRPMMSEAMVQVFAEDILLPKLVAHIKTTGLTGEMCIPSHVWIHPWLPVTGRKALVEVLHHVRISLAVSLEAWRLSDSTLRRRELIENTKKWSTILSRKKLQLTLSRHVAPKLATALAEIDGSTEEAPIVLGVLSEWASVCSNRLLATELAEAFIKGPGATLQRAAFRDWHAAKRMYQRWSSGLPGRLRIHFRPTLAALLFVLHAAATTNKDTKARLSHADITPLLNNRFRRVERKKVKIDRPIVPAKKARLVDVVAMVAEKEGLPLIGLPDERGHRVFKLGRIRVTADVRRGVFLINGEVVSVDKMVKMAKNF
ncbi:Tuftelin interacting protein [Gracilaria domingensis]|nr:Tuftelin interacting protein [Gracilaria domingensis]